MVTDVFNMLMYADDTTLYCNINQNVSEVAINNELLKVSQWLAANKLKSWRSENHTPHYYWLNQSK